MACKQIEQGKELNQINKTPEWFDDFDKFLSLLDAHVKQRHLSKEFIILSENNHHQNSRIDNLRYGLRENGYSVVIKQIDLQNNKIMTHD